METNAQAINLLKQALTLLEGSPAKAPSAPSVTAKPDEEVLEGFIQDPQFRHVGDNNIPLFTANMETDELTTRVQAWRKVAEWSSAHLPVGAHVRAFGRWEEKTWTDRNGERRTTKQFSVRAFEPL